MGGGGSLETVLILTEMAIHVVVVVVFLRLCLHNKHFMLFVEDVVQDLQEVQVVYE